MNQRLRTQNRLRKAGDFELIRKTAKKADCSAFMLFVARRDDSGGAFSRLGIVASKRVGCAVERNKLKRRFRDIFRKNLENLPTGCDFVIFVRRAALNFEYSNLAERFLRAAKNLTETKKDV